MTKTILVIEDDRDILDIMVYILADEGFDVISATSAEPLSNLNVIRPAMILLDNRLAEGFGKDFCRTIKQNPDTAHLPVIIVSANRDIESLARESMADGYIAKPFDLTELLDTVNRYC